MKLERLHLNRKKVITAVIATIVLVVGIMIIKHTYSIGTEDSLFNQTVESLKFSDGEVETANGISTVKVKVENESEEEYKLKTITIEVKTETETINLVGYIGDSLESKEEKMISASIDKDIKDIKEVKYTINK